MGVPAHVHDDWHIIGDAYEDWMRDNHGGWGAADANAAGGLIAIPDSARETILGTALLIPVPQDFGVSLYYLMYMTNQHADYFASDDVDGDTRDRYGWMDYTGWPDDPLTTGDLEGDNSDGDLTRIADTAFVYAIRATATLYRAWRDYFDPTAPSTHIEVSGPAGNNGWYIGDVQATLSASDNVGGSGVYETQYMFSVALSRKQGCGAGTPSAPTPATAGCTTALAKCASAPTRGSTRSTVTASSGSATTTDTSALPTARPSCG